MTGMPGNYITDIQLSDIQMVMPGGGSSEDAAKTDINEYTLDVLNGWWPEFIGVGTLPASAIYMRHMNDVYLNNIQIKTVSNDEVLMCAAVCRRPRCHRANDPVG